MVNVISLFAHPDDETMLAGGTLALLARAGATIHYVCSTRGEGGETGDPAVCERSELGQVREQEMDCAVKALGGSSLTFLDYQDPLVGPEDALFAYTSNQDDLAEKIAGCIQRLEAGYVITHGSNGEYGHPAHILTYQAAIQAVRSFSPSPALYTIQAFFPEHPKPRHANKNDLADLVIDASAVLEQKTLAALCHRSQHALFVRRASLDAARPLTVPEVIIFIESLHRVRLDGQETGPDQLLDLLKPYRLTA
jgi:N-acetylglucosamine malate deacetylase 2